MQKKGKSRDMNKKWECIELDNEKIKNVEKIENEYGISNLFFV